MPPSSQTELYIDGLLDVSFARGVVRVDLYSYSAQEKHSNGQPKSEFRQRLVMSAQNFVEFVGGLQLAVQSLHERGALPMAQVVTGGQAQPAPVSEFAPAPVPVPVAKPVETKKGPPRSPNFAPPAANTPE